MSRFPDIDAEALDAIQVSSRPVPRRSAFVLAGSVVVIRPPVIERSHPNTDVIEPPPAFHIPAVPAFAAELTQARAQAEWAHFKSRFIQPDGRVLDNGNGGISHSEGQGLALLFAAHFGEADTFARILHWTREVLARPEDHLLAWCHRPGAAARPADRNNATDGDLLAAWALAEAAGRWGHAPYRGLAVAMARDILGKMVIGGEDGPILLPGIQGFQQPHGITVNPSYYVHPAFQALGRILPGPQWAALEQGGLQLARAARFGRWGLVPDWAWLPRGRGAIGIAPERPARFSYDAVRVPLYLSWAGHGGEPMVGAADRFWNDPGHVRMPAWTDLRTDEVSPYEADKGIAAVAQLSTISARPGVRSRQMNAPILSATYYAAALRLMAVLALRTMPARSGIVRVAAAGAR